MNMTDIRKSKDNGADFERLADDIRTLRFMTHMLEEQLEAIRRRLVSDEAALNLDVSKVSGDYELFVDNRKQADYMMRIIGSMENQCDVLLSPALISSTGKSKSEVA